MNECLKDLHVKTVRPSFESKKSMEKLIKAIFRELKNEYGEAKIPTGYVESVYPQSYEQPEFSMKLGDTVVVRAKVLPSGDLEVATRELAEEHGQPQWTKFFE